MKSIQENIVSWLKSQRGWQTELAYRILCHNIKESDVAEIVSMVKSQTPFEDKPFPTIVLGLGNADVCLRLTEISDVHNIEGLAPRTPLKFDEDKNLTVVYGANGSGKSSYARIIRCLCGSSHAPQLKTNVFKQESGDSECKVVYTLNGRKTEKQWLSASGAIPELATIDIFDSDISQRYLHDANPCTYIPSVIALFEDLAKWYGVISQKLQAERDVLVSRVPMMPNEHLGTDVAKCYGKITKDSSETSLRQILEFTEEDAVTLDGLRSRLLEKDPAQRATEIRTQKTAILKIIDTLENALAKVSASSWHTLCEMKRDASEARKLANESAAVLSESATLPSIGSPVWKELWKAAKKYSEENAYVGIRFPNVGDGARCVLCHQELDVSAKRRIQAFHDYVEGEFEKKSTEVENAVKTYIDGLPVAPTMERLGLEVTASHLKSEWIEKLGKSWAIIDGVKDLFLKMASDGSCSDVYDGVTNDINGVQSVINELKTCVSECEKQAFLYDTDARNSDRRETQAKISELSAKKWCSEQREAILDEINRLRKCADYDAWILQCKTNAITAKAGEVAKLILTGEYQSRFNSELERLKASRLRVSISSFNNKGVIKHSIVLRNAASKTEVASVLSEGECRIVALAAFLADVTANDSNSPFVFDDPICSLDQEFEECVVDRLVELSKTRQVIVFTHRLSVLGLLGDKANDIQIVGTYSEPWGAGEIGSTPLFAKNTQKALNALKNDYLPRAREAYQQGWRQYYTFGKQLCSDLRIIVERSVEIDLLADVVQRYRRAVNTMGKIRNLLRIRREDCELIDDFMTRYSRYEHSQSAEAPVNLPNPDEIERDIDKLIAWRQEFVKRTVED